MGPVTTDPKGEAHATPSAQHAGPHPSAFVEEVGTYGGLSTDRGVVMTGKLHPWYITGIVEGEGSFCVSFSRRKRLKVGIETRPSFSITLGKRDLQLLKRIHQYFSCGGIRYSRSDRTYKFEVRSVKEIVRKVLPHFERYPLSGAKREDFEKFARICRMVHSNLHLNRENLKEIIEIAYGMNPSGKRKYSRKELLRVLGEVKV